MSNLQNTQLQFAVTANQRIPREGPKVVPVTIPFTGPNTDFDIDLGQQEQLAKVSMIQSCFIDNSANGSPAVITAVDTQQSIKIAANSQAFLPLFCLTPTRIHFNSAGAVTVIVILCNFPLSPAVWKSQ